MKYEVRQNELMNKGNFFKKFVERFDFDIKSAVKLFVYIYLQI